MGICLFYCNMPITNDVKKDKCSTNVQEKTKVEKIIKVGCIFL